MVDEKFVGWLRTHSSFWKSNCGGNGVETWPLLSFCEKTACWLALWRILPNSVCWRSHQFQSRSSRRAQIWGYKKHSIHPKSWFCWRYQRANGKIPVKANTTEKAIQPSPFMSTKNSTQLPEWCHCIQTWNAKMGATKTVSTKWRFLYLILITMPETVGQELI